MIMQVDTYIKLITYASEVEINSLGNDVKIPLDLRPGN